MIRKTKPGMALLAVTGLWLFFSCELPVEENIYEEKLVVFGNLVANLPVVDTLFVSLSYTINEPHEEEAKWVRDALVILDDGHTLFSLSAVAGKPGRYLDTTYSYTVRPRKTYRLDVAWRGLEATAVTTVPDTFVLESIPSSRWACNGETQVVRSIDLHLDENTPERIRLAMMNGDWTGLPMDTVTYREGECWSTSFASIPLFVLKWEADYEPGLIRIISLALNDTVTRAIVDTSLSALAFKGPMYRDDNGNYYRPNPFVWNARQSEQPINWIYFNYTGPHLITVVAMDPSIHDYFRGDPFRINQYVLPGGNIEGGYGLFSSSFARSFLVYVDRDTTGGNSPGR